MPLLQDETTNRFFAVCEHCQMQSMLFGEDYLVALIRLSGEFGWTVTDGGEVTACCKEHWDAADCTGMVDKIELDMIEEILDEYDQRPELN